LYAEVSQIRTQHALHLAGNATAVINADLYSTDAYVASVIEKSNLTVRGNLNLTGIKQGYGVFGLWIIDNSTVTVNGNITGELKGTEGGKGGSVIGAQVHNSYLTVNGNVSVDGNGIEANNSQVVVNGNIDSGAIGILADRNAEVTVNGILTLRDATFSYAIIGDIIGKNAFFITEPIDQSNLSKPGYLGYIYRKLRTVKGLVKTGLY